MAVQIMQNTDRTLDQFGERLSDYEQWKIKITAAIESYQEWYDSQQDGDTDEELRLYELIEELRNDTLTIALVGEFSRGKTELINAIFFSDYHRRLLPSTPGRTTMCTTEILYDDKVDPCIKLLPIESRKSPLTISELKKSKIHWTTLPLNLDSAEEMAETLQEIVKNKQVTQREARELGLMRAAENVEEGSTIEVPTWRHAVINYPHRLLKLGLAVLDTPGLNALGSEPELTLSMLSKAHAILFVLAADTGVTRTDMEVWKNHVCVATNDNAHARIAALNKIDTLWDDLENEQEIDGFINRQAEETRRLLDVDPGMVFPVSAQKGLLGKIKNNDELLSKSGLLKLEKKLSEDIVVHKQNLIRDKIMSEIGSVVSASHELVKNRIATLNTELEEIQKMRGKSVDVIDEMAKKLQTQKERYDKEVQSFQVTRRILSDQVKRMLKRLSMSRYDQLIIKTRMAMRNSWTTTGLKGGMSTFFGGTFKDLRKVEAQAEEIRTLVEKIYNKFHKDHGLPRTDPAKFSASTFMKKYQGLYTEAEAFRNSPSMLVTEQHYVTKKFFITLVSRARIIFQDCNLSALNWAKSVLTPIYTQIQEHKIMIDRRLENLEKLRGNQTVLSERLAEIEEEMSSLNQQANLIDDILGNITNSGAEQPSTLVVETEEEAAFPAAS